LQTSTPKAAEPVASTSKASPATPTSARGGRKRVGKPAEEEVPEKVAKVEVTPVKPVAAAPKAKAVAKAKPVKTTGELNVRTSKEVN
jgi:hypothetical protein